jgi:hypothetical protein
MAAKNVIAAVPLRTEYMSLIGSVFGNGGVVYPMRVWLRVTSPRGNAI